MSVIQEGDPQAPAYVFLHGWPETADCWREVMHRAATDGNFAVALNLLDLSTDSTGSTGSTDSTDSTDGTGSTGSTGRTHGTDGTKTALAAAVRETIQPLGLKDVTLVGHDCGGMVAFAYLRAYGEELRRAVIMNTVVPGVAPWDEVLRNPYIWHFGFHAVPGLPELLVRGREREYFDYFYDILSPDPSAVPAAARERYAAAYANNLEAGFRWYRAFAEDAKANEAPVDVRTPLLYLRGEHEGGDIAAYARGLRAAGIRDVTTGVLAGAGHFAPDQVPDEVWRHING
ncbi:alpha/beta fold hydrolase [Dactylosporangium sp. CS-033363]|uniref:alpha/beta fold hydrolase n=1 Tax=Dactylosporangium sp. CS-033363 TaxID=3239935 RepID=UPI003D8C8D80